MKLIVAFAAVILAANALSATNHWEKFKATHNKTYKTAAEENIRYAIFRQNVELINEHNARHARGEETYTMVINQFADMSKEEFSQYLNKHKKPVTKGELHEFSENLEVPDSIDWREKNAVLGVKNQGSCGSCWAFSTTGALEGQNAILNGKSISLSEQQLLDCSGSYGNGDCDYGGLMVWGFEYVRDNGIVTEADYPYEAVQRSCRASSKTSVLKIKGYKELQASEDALKNGVGSVGPISVAIYAEPIQFYSSGIFKSNSCKASEDYLDHGVLAVGYGTENGQDYWIVKNSWGASWGEKGYFRLARNANNQCGIALETSYPTL